LSFSCIHQLACSYVSTITYLALLQEVIVLILRPWIWLDRHFPLSVVLPREKKLFITSDDSSKLGLEAWGVGLMDEGKEDRGKEILGVDVAKVEVCC